MLISFKNIYFSYHKKTIFKDFSFDIQKNDKLLVYGPSGIGKSTFLKLILFFLVPQKGEIFFKQRKIDETNVSFLRKHIAYAPQDINISEATVSSLVKDIKNFPVNKHIKNFEQKFLNNIYDLSLNKEIFSKRLNELSGGEAQRVSVAISISLDREVILFDEPTSSLDKNSKLLVIKKIDSLVNKTIIVVSHDKEWFDTDFKKFDFKKQVLS